MINQTPHRALIKERIFVVFAVITLLLLAFVPSVLAEKETDEESGWEFEVAPYLWALALDGDVTVKGQDSDLDVPFSEIWDELNIAAMLAFQGRKDRWGFYGDVIYANLGHSTDVNGIGIDPDINVMWLTAGGFYRLGTWDLSNTPGKKVPTVAADIFAGARYTYLDVELNIEGFPDPEGDQDWVDPLIGARALFDLSERWNLSLDGSIGGFGVGSDFAWHAWGLIAYRFPLFSKKDNARVVGGYRALSQDYDTGSGNDKFKWDVTLHGPVLGLIITF